MRSRQATSFGLGLLGVGTASVVAHNARGVMRTRKAAKKLRIPLEHDGVVGAGLGEPTRLWVLGDSASDGYGLQDAADAFPAHVASRLALQTSRRVQLTSIGRDGARVADVTLEQVPQLDSDVDVIAVLVGANDVFGRRSRKQIVGDASEMLDALHRKSAGATIVVAGCPDFGKAHGFPQPLRTVLGWRCRVTAKAIGEACAAAGIPFVDIVPDTRSDLFGEDGVHPNREASVEMSRGVVEQMMLAGAALAG